MRITKQTAKKYEYGTENGNGNAERTQLSRASDRRVAVRNLTPKAFRIPIPVLYSVFVLFRSLFPILVLGCIPLACSSGEAAAPRFDPFANRAVRSVDAALDGLGDGATDAAPIAPEYLAAESVIRTQCAFVRCHGGNVRGGAGLWYDQTASIRGPLVNVPACEYDKMMRVKPGDVADSWIITKLEAAQDPQTHAIDFTPQPDWVPNPACGLDSNDAGGRFGLRMPATTFHLDADSISKLVTWIAAGAPGPD